MFLVIALFIDLYIYIEPSIANFVVVLYKLHFEIHSKFRTLHIV